MRRSRFATLVFSDAAFTDASTAAASVVSMSTRPAFRGGRTRGSGDSSSNIDHRPSFRPRHFNDGQSYRQHQQQPGQHQPPFNQNYEFRPPPSGSHWQQFHHRNPSPSNNNYTACPPPPFYQTQMPRPPPQRSLRQRPRSKPSDYREWEYAKTAPPSGSEKFVVLSYNILADYLANDHRGQLYSHIPRNMLSWEWRKSKIVFELGLWSADIMCLQEVDRFQDLEEEMKLRGYSGIWKMRTGNAIDGCAMFWRSNRFKLVHEESIQFNQLGLRENVAQICVLELLNSNTKEDDASTSESSAGPRRVVICNIHVLYNPKRGDFKLGQVRTLLERSQAASKLWDDAPVVLCGDFNCTPKSHLYNFIMERKLDLSGVPRNNVSGQDSAVIRSRRPEIYTSRSQSPQVEVQPSDSIANAHMENTSNRDVENGPTRNTSELPCADTVLDGREAISSNSDSNLGRETIKPQDSGDLSIAEDLVSVTISDPETPHAANAKEDLIEEVPVSSALSATEHSPEETVSNDENLSSNTLSEMKLESLTLDEPVVSVQDEEGLGEDGEISKEFSRESGSEAYDIEKIRYDPSSWTPMEIATASGDPGRTKIEHTLQLKSTYSEVEGKANTRDENGEPVVTSYHRCFMGTVDYIWRSEGLQTVRVLAPISKQAMQWTPGFPTPKWGSDHIALVSELAFCSSKETTPKD